jgi:glyoxylase-like metal-dependent hydrolase (beta-lactamase superfamily II)
MGLGLAKWSYQKGLTDLGNGAYAYLQPDGGWGWSNAGLVVDSGEALLVDTLFDLRLTQEMLTEMRAAEPEATARIGTLVNTHSNGDHVNGNELVSGAEIVASRACAEEMQRESAATMAAMLKNADTSQPMGAFFVECFGQFEFDGITPTPPTVTFDDRLTRQVGNKRVELINVGPAHTGGDVLVHVPADRTVYTGDILFIEGHPIIWAGPVQNWIDACQWIADLDVETVVPGHGPITDRRGALAVKEYLEYITAEARRRFDAGLGAFEAAQDISLADYSAWGDAERIAVNVATLYREFAADSEPADIASLFGQMATLAKSR